jgi:hypothetical protein
MRCKACGERVERGSNRFCNKECYVAFHRSQTIRICPTCGSEFSRPRCQKQTFCSMKCVQYTGSAGRGRMTNCAQCGVRFQRHITKIGYREFCSVACARKAPPILDPAAWVTLTCTNCGESFKRSRGTNRFKAKAGLKAFCSNRCVTQFHRGDKHGLWKGGRSPVNNKRIQAPGWKAKAMAARERDEFKCGICAIQWKKGMPVFHVDHVVPHILAEQLAAGHADDPQNLLTLCPSHHGRKAGAERSLNRGDRLRWEERLRGLGYPMERVAASFDYFRTVNP